MLVILTLIFIGLVLVIGGERTAKSLVILGGNAAVLLATIFCMYLGLNPLAAAIAACVIISVNTLFNQNEINEKTGTALASVLAVIGLTFALIFFFCGNAAVQGFPVGQYEVSEANGYSPDIGLNMILVEISVMLMVLIGAVIDTALAITSSLYEVHRNNPHLGSLELFLSGNRIGKDILSSTIQTLFFIFMAEYFTLFLQFADEYTFSQIINSKEFCQEFISISISGLGCVLIIPVASWLGALYFTRDRNQDSRMDWRCFRKTQ